MIISRVNRVNEFLKIFSLFNNEGNVCQCNIVVISMQALIYYFSILLIKNLVTINL